MKTLTDLEIERREDGFVLRLTGEDGAAKERLVSRGVLLRLQDRLDQALKDSARRREAQADTYQKPLG